MNKFGKDEKQEILAHNFLRQKKERDTLYRINNNNKMNWTKRIKLLKMMVITKIMI